MKLGWRNPRPNDFQTPDQRPLKDMFGNMQQFMTWPHFDVEIDDGQATSGGALAKLTITPQPGGDPYSLVRANDTIQVPTDFQTWMLVAQAGIIAAVAGPARCIMDWRLGGFPLSFYGEETVTKAGGTDVRLTAPIIVPMTAGVSLDIAAFTEGGGTVTLGRATGFFLPLV